MDAVLIYRDSRQFTVTSRFLQTHCRQKPFKTREAFPESRILIAKMLLLLQLDLALFWHRFWTSQYSTTYSWCHLCLWRKYHLPQNTVGREFKGIWIVGNQQNTPRMENKKTTKKTKAYETKQQSWNRSADVWESLTRFTPCGHSSQLQNDTCTNHPLESISASPSLRQLSIAPVPKNRSATEIIRPTSRNLLQPRTKARRGSSFYRLILWRC